MHKSKTTSIKNFILAGLISEGEYDTFSHNPVLKIPLNYKKMFYLEDIVKERELEPFIDINWKRQQFSIHSHEILAKLRIQWYEGNHKIFSKVIDPNLLTIESIVLSINLFGIRNLETISIPTTVDKNYIRVLAYCVEQHLKVPVIPASNQIKITNIPYVINSIIKKIPTIHGVELLNILTEKEKKRLIEGE